MAAELLPPAEDHDDDVPDHLHVVPDAPETDGLRDRVRARVDAWWADALDSADRPAADGPRAMTWPGRIHVHLYDTDGARAALVGTGVMLRAVRPAKPKGAGERKLWHVQDVIGAGILALIGGGVLVQAARTYPYPFIVSGVLAVLVWAPAAWVVGSWELRRRSAAAVGEEEISAEAEEAGAQPDEAGETDPLAETQPARGWWTEESPERAQQLFYEWLRVWMGGGNVHLRTLLQDMHRTPGLEHHTMASLKAELKARGVPVRGGVKAPTFDPDEGVKNRPGIHSSAVPNAHTPFPGPGPAETRLLPRLPPP